MQTIRLMALAFVCGITLVVAGHAQQTDDRIASSGAAPDRHSQDWPLLYATSFSDESALEQWEFIGGNWSWRAWDQEEKAGELGKLVLTKAPDRYTPPVRSPTQLAVLKEIAVTDFQLDVWVCATHPVYGHRDVCVYFGYVDPQQYYYVHLADQTDDRANQVFIVNRADRSKISRSTSAGTPWDDRSHHVRVRRNADTGSIEVFFDDMRQPVMTAEDRTFPSGRIGVGSFDDAADFHRVELRGVKPAEADRQELPVPFAASPNRAFCLGHRFSGFRFHRRPRNLAG